MKNIRNRIYESSHDIKLKIFWTQCISVLFLIFVISVALNILYFNVSRLMIEIALILGIIIMLTLSYKTKKLKPYNYLMLLTSNFFIITLLIILDEMSKVTVFSYFSILILFTVVLFEKKEKIIFVILECLIYGMFAYYIFTTKDVNFVVYNMLIQIFISTCTMCASFLTVLKMYEVNAINLQQINNELKSAALKDSLTDLWNRQYMERLLDEMIPHKAQNFSVVMFDIDHFKQINDTYGHPMGDKVLKKLADIITKLIPMDASAIRYGGEEFLIVLPEKNTKEASEIANKIRKKVETDLKIKGIKNKITISGGVKEYNEDLTKVTLIEEADKNLYAAKQNGRNKVVI